jgi:hypothetical protein
LFRIVHRLWVKLLPVQLILIMGAIGLTVGLTCSLTIILTRGEAFAFPLGGAVVSNPEPPPVVANSIAPVFTVEVQYWSPRIMEWSREYGVDPNMIATVIQIESCGDPLAGSSAGAQGLFQVMPFHFTEGEDMHDPDTNARRGIEYLKGGLIKADGHIGLAMAGYNGGWGVIDQGWSGWYRETRLYYMWGSQIYLDALQGKTPLQSNALQHWLNAGGAGLCAQASLRLIATPTPTQQVVQPTIEILPGQ